MAKNLLKQVFTSDGLEATLLNTAFNMGVTWFLGNTANIISNSAFHFDLNKYNSVKHAVGDVGIATFVYRRAGGGLKGFLSALGVITTINIAWESFENGLVFHSNVFKDKESFIDTFSDVMIGYVSAVLVPYAEKLKGYIPQRRKYPNRKEKWVL